MKLSIVTVNWNGGNLLKKCLNSIYQHTQGIDFEIIVVDNGSTDRSIDFLRNPNNPHHVIPSDSDKIEQSENFIGGDEGSVSRQDNTFFKQEKNIILIQNSSNLGFAKANNQGIKKSKGEYILLLNNDTELIENSFKKMIEFMDSNSKCGILACKLLNSNKTLQRACRRFPSLLSQILILIKAHNVCLGLPPLKKYYMFDFDHDSTREIDQVEGSCFLIRRQTLNEVGILDEGFWFWFDEVDYCRRAKDKNWKIFFTPQTAIVHHKGASGKKHNLLFRQRKFNQSMLRYFKKHKPLWQWFILWCLQPVSWLATLFLQLLFILKIPLVKNKDL